MQLRQGYIAMSRVKFEATSACKQELLQKGGRSPTPEMELFPDYDPLWKNDLSGNWIINGPRQRDEDVGLEKPSESEPSVPWGHLGRRRARKIM